MIISASRRTDIPAFFSSWLMKRIEEKFVFVRNPINKRQISKISLEPDVIDCIVFWTKNPENMMQYIKFLEDYNFYFQFTLSSYGIDIESKVPNKNVHIIKTFLKLSEMIGRNRLIWRYDPIIISPSYGIDYHVKYFEVLAKQLSPYTRHCVISFIDIYKNIKASLTSLDIGEIDFEQQERIVRLLVEIANSYNLKLVSCAESLDYTHLGVSGGKCIDDDIVSELLGYNIDISKDQTQRKECGCVSSIDIGAYNTCPHSCKYCYANHNVNTVKYNLSEYDISSPLLCDHLRSDDVITERKMKKLPRLNTQQEFEL